MHDKIEAALLAHFHGPGYNAVGHGSPDDCAPCHEATHVALAAMEHERTPENTVFAAEGDKP